MSNQIFSMAKEMPNWINFLKNSIAGNTILLLNSLCLMGLAVYVFIQHQEKTTFQLFCGGFVLLLGLVSFTQRVVWFMKHKNIQH
jgi:hypothetical protein